MNVLSRTVMALFVGLLFMAGSGAEVRGGPPPRYFVDESKLPFDPIEGVETERFWGIHNRAGFRIEIPLEWNGDLVVWAHGFRGTVLELTVNDPPFRDWLVANGFAWAASSYSRNDYDVAQGAKDTHALTRFFKQFGGQPDHTYIAGASMGGHVTAVVIEQWPKAYDGAMPVCGTLGDHELFDYFLDFNMVAAALANVEIEYPTRPEFLSEDVPAIKAALESAPDSFPVLLNMRGEVLKTVTMLLSGGERPLFDQAFIFWNGVAGDVLFGLGALDGTVPRSPGIVVDNADTVYQFDSDLTLTPDEQALNDTVFRVTRDPQGIAPNGLANVPVVSGSISIPVVTLHTIGDLFVPISMEQVYARRVAQHGASDLLVQRAIRDVAHCGFTGEELATAFVDLVNWVENGVRPEGDDFLDPDAVADPDFGCKFTSEDRVFPPPLEIPPCD